MNIKYPLLGIILGIALLAGSVETSQAQAPYQGIMKCTVSWKGDYKFYDGQFPELTGNCLKLRGTYRGYIVSRTPDYDIFFVNSKTKEFSLVTGCKWDCTYQFSCGKKQDKIELCLSACKNINITEGNLDIERCEIKCLTGRTKEINLGDRANPFAFAVTPTLKGTYCRQSCYIGTGARTCFLPKTPGKTDFNYDRQGITAGALSCITAKCSYRLDTKLTKAWYASGDFDKPGKALDLVQTFLEDKGHTSLGEITDAEFCALQNLTGGEPFLP